MGSSGPQKLLDLSLVKRLTTFFVATRERSGEGSGAGQNKEDWLDDAQDLALADNAQFLPDDGVALDDTSSHHHSPNEEDSNLHYDGELFS